MANTSFLPVREAELVTWSNNFDTKITATPTAFGLTAAQATAYTTLNTAFINAYNTANNDSTNSRSATIAKNAAKKALIASARQLAGIVQKNPATTNTQRADLGLTVAAKPKPIPAPTRRPYTDVTKVAGRTVTVSIHGSGSKSAKPAGSISAFVYTFIGETYPSDPTAWQFQGPATKSTYDIVFADSVAAGAQVWVCAAWVNRRGDTGPVSVPVTTNIQGGGASSTSSMKIAA